MMKGCVLCGAPVVREQFSLCQNCYNKQFENVTCPVCGRVFRRKKTEPWRNVCIQCYYTNEPCAGGV